MTAVKSAQAPSEEALALVHFLRATYQVAIPANGVPLLAFSLTEDQAVSAIDSFAAHRLSTALRNPSEDMVEAAAREIFKIARGGVPCPPKSDAWRDYEKDVRNAFRAAAMEITGEG